MLKIKEIRKNKKISQEELAAKTGFSVRSIINYEKDDADIPYNKLQDIAHALEVKVADLLPDSEKYAGLAQLAEPSVVYAPENVTDLLSTKNELINELKRENQDLRTDKEFFRDLLKSKIFES